jgi:transcriptional regulator with GAF, ATPase, and Fis domain/CHASE2 domain-containing sensor protein
LLLLSGFTKNADRTFENIYSFIAGEKSPDTNIVIIHISASDLERIGPWPIKRSYYALLIKELTKQNVKKIGLEVFLSSRMVTQTIYDKLLRNEIAKSGRVILSSVAGKITESENTYFTDSLSYPSPKLLDDSFLSGHLNYITDAGIKIPLSIDNRGEVEKAFAYQLYENESNEIAILINARSSWKSFENYNLIKFFEFVRNDAAELKLLKDKTVFIGMSDPQFASTVTTLFDDKLPGVALHAFALDNLINSSWQKSNLYVISGLLFVFILLGLVLIHPMMRAKLVYFYLFTLGVFLVITFVLFIGLNYRLAFSLFYIPFFFLVMLDLAYSLFESKHLLKGALDESEVLKKLLASKQDELQRLQKELDITEETGSAGLITKIKTLKSDIEKLKEDEEDKTPADIKPKELANNFHGIVYCSKAMDEIVGVIKKVAPENATVLLIGESGTGKELAARAIHNLSQRREKTFVAVNCAALTESLLESELFGHLKGAFTGAATDKIGRFEAADGGTIFLDEIGETSENFQVKLLRVLQSGEIEKVGSAGQSNVDVRVVAATNKELDLLVKEKKFREDLFYRLNVIQIKMPPLRERPEDIEILASHFLSAEGSGIRFSKSASAAILDFEWSGNVRELESVVKRAVIFARAEGRDLLKLSDLPKEIVKGSKYNFEDLVLESLREKKFSHSAITETAKELGNVNRTMISENFRGIVFRTLYENNFDIALSVESISVAEGEDVRAKVEDKIQKYIINIENDIAKTGLTNFDEVKIKFASKYKNLPAKFHLYLDEVIKWKLN